MVAGIGFTQEARAVDSLLRFCVWRVIDCWLDTFWGPLGQKFSGRDGVLTRGAVDGDRCGVGLQPGGKRIESWMPLEGGGLPGVRRGGFAVTDGLNEIDEEEELGGGEEESGVGDVVVEGDCLREKLAGGA